MKWVTRALVALLVLIVIAAIGAFVAFKWFEAEINAPGPLAGGEARR